MSILKTVLQVKVDSQLPHRAAFCAWQARSKLLLFQNFLLKITITFWEHVRRETVGPITSSVQKPETDGKNAPLTLSK